MTSEDPTENLPASHTGGEPNAQPNSPDPHIPEGPGAPKLPPYRAHCEVTCKTEKDNWDKFKRVLEIVGVVLLAIYTSYTIGMYHSNKQAADAATNAATTSRQSFRADQRAWIVPSYSPAPLSISLHTTLSEPFTFVNTGRTPARDIRGDVILDIFSNDKAPDFDYSPGHGRKEFQVGLLFPNSPRSMAISAANGNKYPSSGVDISSTTIAAYHSGGSYIALYGEITYIDVFGRSHWVHFCSARPPGGATATDGRRVCAEYNGVDPDIE